MTLGMMATDVEQRIDFDALRKYRLQRAREQMEKYDLGALLCMDQDNVRYITSTNLAEWTRGKYFRWCVLPRDGDPVLFEVGTAVVAKRKLCPWLKPENIRVSTPWNRGAYMFSAATRNQVFRWLNNLWANRRKSALVNNLVKRAKKPGFYRDAKHVPWG